METLKPVVFASDCDECEWCGEKVCWRCNIHYWECDCPGPSQDDLYDYTEIDGELYAMPKQEKPD